ncbi:MAG: glycosyl transferase [Hydrogenophilales bacterium]|nr:glycosyl transferase [Hydrogenophilales bacterium]
MTEIPRHFHFVFGLRPQTEPLHIAHFLCLESCRRVYRPDAIHFHYRHEPYGPYWERIRPYLTLHRVNEAENRIDMQRYNDTEEGRFIAKAGFTYAHEADFIRLAALLEHGGVYADIDTLFVQTMPDHLFRHDFVLGEEAALTDPDGILRPSLCNALILGRPDAAYPARWLERMGEVFDGTWSRHSCQEAARLWGEMPESLHVVPERYFYRHPPTQAGIRMLFEDLDTDFNEVYSMHLWAHLWWDEWRTDFTVFHAGLLNEDHIRNTDTTYNVIARAFLD